MGNPISKIKERLVRRVEVFGFGSSAAKFRVEVEEAVTMIAIGNARRISKYKILLTQKGEHAIKARYIQLHDQSAQMGPRVIEDYAMGHRKAVNALEAWMVQLPVVGA